MLAQRISQAIQVSARIIGSLGLVNACIFYAKIGRLDPLSRHKVLRHNSDFSIFLNMRLSTFKMLDAGAPPPLKPMLILGLDVTGGCCRCIPIPLQNLRQHCLGGDGGLSPIVSIYGMAIKHSLIPFGEDCSSQ